MVVEPGDTKKLAPLAVVPMATPPDGTVYQLILFPVEMAFRLLDAPMHIAEGLAVTEVGDAGTGVTLIVVEIHPVVLQVPEYLAKYVVVEPGATEIEAPLPTKVLPQLPEYHCTEAPDPRDPPTAVSVVAVPAQIVVAPEMDVGATDAEFTFTVTEAHPVMLHVPEYLAK